MTTILERLAARSMPLPFSGCIVWTGSKCRGYGRIYHDGKTRATHRVAFETFRGKIPEGLEINHLCRNKACINPAHLEVVTGSQNLRYDYAIKPWGNQNTGKTHCPRGHAYSGDNLRVISGKRYCKTCVNEQKRERRQSCK
mgnify:CR=1 FL=1